MSRSVGALARAGAALMLIGGALGYASTQLGAGLDAELKLRIAAVGFFVLGVSRVVVATYRLGRDRRYWAAAIARRPDRSPGTSERAVERSTSISTDQ